MKKIYYLIFASLIAGLMVQGFSCGSPELEGAKLAVKGEKYDDAISLLEKEISKNPNNADAWYLLGDVKARKNDFEGMNDAFKKSLSISNVRAEDIKNDRNKYWYEHVHKGLDYLKADTANYQKAAEEFKYGVAAIPDTFITYHFLAFAYSGLGDLDDAILNFDKAWKMGRDTISFQYNGLCLLQRGLSRRQKFEKDNEKQITIKNALKEFAKGSLKSDVLDVFGEPDSKKKDKSRSGKEQWEYKQYGVVFTIDGNSVAAKKVIKAYKPKIDSTDYYSAVDDFNRSIESFEMVRKTNPMDNENLIRLLQAYIEADRISEGIKIFKLAIENDPGNKVNHDVLGRLYRTQQDYANAIVEFKEALNIDPEYIDALYDLGATYYNWGVRIKNEAIDKGSESTEYKKKLEEALPWMEKVSQLKPDDINVWQTLGTIYTILAQKEKALKAFGEVDRLQKQGIK